MLSLSHVVKHDISPALVVENRRCRNKAKPEALNGRSRHELLAETQVDDSDNTVFNGAFNNHDHIPFR